MSTKTVTTWKTAHEFESKLGDNSIQLDGSKKNGFGPKALLLSGLAACSGIDVVIDTEAEQVDEHPKVFTDILVTYRIKTDAANEDKVRKAIDLSLEKYCGVAAMLRKNSAINYKLVIE